MYRHSCTRRHTITDTSTVQSTLIPLPPFPYPPCPETRPSTHSRIPSRHPSPPLAARGSPRSACQTVPSLLHACTSHRGQPHARTHTTTTTRTRTRTRTRTQEHNHKNTYKPKQDAPTDNVARTPPTRTRTRPAQVYIRTSVHPPYFLLTIFLLPSVRDAAASASAAAGGAACYVRRRRLVVSDVAGGGGWDVGMLG